MLTAYDKDGNYYIASKDLEKRDYEYLCPVCRHVYKGENKSYVFLRPGHKTDDNPRGRVPHFVHYFKVMNHYWENESLKHVLMKMNLYTYFKKFPWVKDIKIEEPVKEKSIELIPDILITTNNNEKIAIECQYSKKHPDKFKEKTKKYSELGIYVLWVFHSDLLALFRYDRNYIYSINLGVNTDNDFLLKNIIIKRTYIYNMYNTYVLKYQDKEAHVVYLDWIYENLGKWNDENSSYEYNINELYAVMQNSNVETIAERLNTCFMKNRILYWCNHKEKDKIIIRKVDKNFEILTRYGMLFGYERVHYLNSKTNEIGFLKTIYNSNIDFSEYQLSERNENYVFLDGKEPDIDIISRKLSYKFSFNDLYDIFKNIENVGIENIKIEK